MYSLVRTVSTFVLVVTPMPPFIDVRGVTGFTTAHSMSVVVGAYMLTFTVVVLTRVSSC